MEAKRLSVGHKQELMDLDIGRDPHYAALEIQSNFGEGKVFDEPPQVYTEMVQVEAKVLDNLYETSNQLGRLENLLKRKWMSDGFYERGTPWKSQRRGGRLFIKEFSKHSSAEAKNVVALEQVLAEGPTVDKKQDKGKGKLFEDAVLNDGVLWSEEALNFFEKGDKMAKVMNKPIFDLNAKFDGNMTVEDWLRLESAKTNADKLVIGNELLTSKEVGTQAVVWNNPMEGSGNNGAQMLAEGGAASNEPLISVVEDEEMMEVGEE